MELNESKFAGHLAMPGRAPLRLRTRDQMMTFDGRNFVMDTKGNQTGQRFDRPLKVGDKVYDSTGAFLVGELERLDMKLHAPLAAVTYTRDIKLREDVTIADEVSSFTTSTFGSPGGLGTGNGIGNGKSWAGKITSQITNVSLDIAKTTNPLTIWIERSQVHGAGAGERRALGPSH